MLRFGSFFRLGIAFLRPVPTFQPMRAEVRFGGLGDGVDNYRLRQPLVATRGNGIVRRYRRSQERR